MVVDWMYEWMVAGVGGGLEVYINEWIDGKMDIICDR